MQKRHTNPNQYFDESSTSCTEFYIPYIQEYTNISVSREYRVLEVGCGYGGNLHPFAKLGCDVTGVDVYQAAIDFAKDNFTKKEGVGDIKSCFYCRDILEFEPDTRFDLIIMHDVIEHIHKKKELLEKLEELLTSGGILYVAFPAWQMPFGGHQQIANSKIVSNFPYIHLLPRKLYRWVLRMFGESPETVDTLLEIVDTRLTIERFRTLASHTDLKIINETFYFINPHYHTKFGFKPRKLYKWVGKIKYLRNFFTSTCYYLLSKQ